MSRGIQEGQPSQEILQIGYKMKKKIYPLFFLHQCRLTSIWHWLMLNHIDLKSADFSAFFKLNLFFLYMKKFRLFWHFWHEKFSAKNLSFACRTAPNSNRFFWSDIKLGVFRHAESNGARINIRFHQFDVNLH